MGNIFATGKKSDQRSSLERVVFANRSSQHRIFVFERVENRLHRGRAIKIDMYLIANFRQRSEMMRKNDADHDCFGGGGGGAIELCSAAIIHFPFCRT